ncbi:MAG: Crp/Fnr family transcriptional regulator [Phenylobacterium sp.]|jgi:CRP-like cAMP-binding protein|uniref:Crp/Fnr family transcriptional regulator n=1 Tax=Phenylobacterium sp. TaxID=1871053 RepID=UPI002A306F74|nr:Crp/Fnr family transcriptional regulator [Phenylobacterium sp.]MDD3836491.1 Crp/Fnr family transcriptional regulator [Phenylobacterium sp.]MDX9998270.1 Crp/Fnr family transcriptional regulator [Phenylobacterium sp.]
MGGASWLRALPAASAEQLLAEARPLELAAGEHLFHQGDPGDAMAVVDAGLLKASLVTARGREVVLAYHAPGDVVGELAVLDGAPRAASICALEASRVRLVAGPRVRAFLEADGALALAVAAMLAQRLRRTNELVEDAAGAPLEMRLARAIVRLLPDAAAGAELRLTQQDLAAYAGLARENVNRQLQDWAQRGLVRLGRGRLQLLAADELVEIAEDLV